MRTRVAIIGAGPAGATTALLLARKGVDAVIFDDGLRPDVIVGESLVPLLTAVFQRLGIEDKVKALGVHKPGVTFTIDADIEFPLSFQAVRGVLPTYAYNVPRREFDQMVLDTALESGARLVIGRPGLQAEPGATPEDSRLLLDADSLALVPDWQGAQPHLVIDASGRRRLGAKALGLKAETGPRRDVAFVAHYEDCPWPEPAGTVIIGRLAHGWSWRIPLPGPRLSIGVVLNKDAARQYGSTPEEQLEGIIAADPRLSRDCARRRRATPVQLYTNYQLISERGSGANWAMVGDAFGFVDPMLSPGLCMAMTSAEKIAALIPADLPEGRLPATVPAGLHTASLWFRQQLTAWQHLIDYFYDGRIFALYCSGQDWSRRHPGLISRFMDRHISKNLAGMAAGALTTDAYARGLLHFLSRHAVRGHSPADFQIN